MCQGPVIRSIGLQWLESQLFLPTRVIVEPATDKDEQHKPHLGEVHDACQDLMLKNGLNRIVRKYDILSTEY